MFKKHVWFIGETKNRYDENGNVISSKMIPHDFSLDKKAVKKSLRFNAEIFKRAGCEVSIEKDGSLVVDHPNDMVSYLHLCKRELI